MITVKDVGLRFGRKDIFKGLTVSINTRKLTAVIGPNGAGKTTLLKMLAGILRPDTGSISLNFPNHAQDVMWVPSHIEMPFAYSVKEVLAMLLHPWLKAAERDAATAMVQHALDSAGLPQFADRIFSSLSAGEQHRIALGAAIVSRARVLILDEPCANLDVGAAHQILLKLREILASDRTLIISIHDLQLAWEYCDEFLLLTPDLGSLQGSRRDIFSNPALSSAFQISVRFVRTDEKELPVFGPPTR